MSCDVLSLTQVTVYVSDCPSPVCFHEHQRQSHAGVQSSIHHIICVVLAHSAATQVFRRSRLADVSYKAVLHRSLID